MKIFISADMDGVAGVAVPRQCDMDNPDYERARVLITVRDGRFRLLAE